MTSRQPSAQLRPSRLHGARLKDAADWLEHYRRLWEGSFDRLDEHLRDIQKKGPEDD